jgi:hypothetical protein
VVAAGIVGTSPATAPVGGTPVPAIVRSPTVVSQPTQTAMPSVTPSSVASPAAATPVPTENAEAASRFWQNTTQPQGFPQGEKGKQTWLIGSGDAIYQPTIESNVWQVQNLASGPIRTMKVSPSKPAKVVWQMDQNLPAGSFAVYTYIPAGQNARASYALGDSCGGQASKPLVVSQDAFTKKWVLIGICALSQANSLRVTLDSNNPGGTSLGIDDVVIIQR